jgi:hypothetical protein
VKKHSVAAPSNAPSCSPNISSGNSISSVKTSLETMQGQDSRVQAHTNAFSRLWHRLLQFRARRLLRSRVFAIPCAQFETSLAAALCASAPPGLELERPLFRIKFPKVIIRFAELHGSLYACVVASVGLASLICNQYESTHVAMLVLNILVLYGLLGFFSCRRHNIDSVAAKHVVTSFRFMSLLLLLLFLFSLEIRLSCINQQSPQAVAAYTIMMMMFILCLLVDCCPNFPPIVQTAISVRKWPITKLFVKNLCLTRVLQATWCVIFGVVAYQDASRVLKSSSHADLDCFAKLGAYQVCTAQIFLTVFSNLFFLALQGFASRVFSPGVSMFVNSSVRGWGRVRAAYELNCLSSFQLMYLECNQFFTFKTYQLACSQTHFTCAPDFGLRQVIKCGK